jgi:sec-independent protein translocase protein TatA
MMGDVAKGLKSFKKGMTDEDEKPIMPKRIEGDRPVDATPERPRTVVEPEERREP